MRRELYTMDEGVVSLPKGDETKEARGHYCYACDEYFHDPNPLVREHVGCQASNYRQVMGICVDASEFITEEIGLFSPLTTKHEVFCIRNWYAYIGYKIPNGNFHFEMVPYTEPNWSQLIGAGIPLDKITTLMGRL